MGRVAFWDAGHISREVLYTRKSVEDGMRLCGATWLVRRMWTLQDLKDGLVKRCSVCWDEVNHQSKRPNDCPNCYGTQKDKGYQDPVVTYMRIMTISTTTQHDSQDGVGSTDPSIQLARLLAFPLLRKNDLLVHKEADRRYLVNEVDYSYLGGKVPVIAMANLMLLQAKDIRYKVPLL